MSDLAMAANLAFLRSSLQVWILSLLLITDVFPESRGDETYSCTHTNEPSRDCILQGIELRKQGPDAGVDGHAGDLAFGILAHNAWPNLYFLLHSKHALKAQLSALSLSMQIFKGINPSFAFRFHCVS